MELLLVLSYFDRKIGPSVFYSYPEHKLKKEDATIIINLMDQMISEGFFTHNFNSSYTMNYYFEIESEWARGNTEFLMISILFNQSTSFITEKVIFNLCIEFSEWLKAKKRIFTAFYKNTKSFHLNYATEIQSNRELIKSWIQEFYLAILDEIQEKLEEENLSSLLEKIDIISTLELLSNKAVPIRDLKLWYNKKFPHNNFHNMLTSLFKNHLIFIPQIGKTKNSPFKIHIKKEAKTIINLICLKNKLIKNFLKNNHNNDTGVIERNSEEFHKFIKRIFSEKQII